MRSQLLKRGTKGASRTINIPVPSHIAEAIDQLAKKLGTTKKAVVLALLKEGLEVVRKRRGGRSH